MNTLTLTLAMSAAISLSLALLAGLILMINQYQRLKRLINDAAALQRMVVLHGDTQLSLDSRLTHIDQQIAKLQHRELQVRSLTASHSSIEAAESLVDESGLTDIEKLAAYSGLTDREASLMIQLRSAYSTDKSSPASGEK